MTLSYCDGPAAELSGAYPIAAQQMPERPVRDDLIKTWSVILEYNGRAEHVDVMPAPDPMYGPAVRCKRNRRAEVIRSCTNVSGLWVELISWLLAIMDVSAQCDLISG